MNNSSEVNWDMNTWKEINDAVVAEVFKVRTAQKVFPTMVLDNNPTSISDEVIDFADLSIKEGQTKPIRRDLCPVRNDRHSGEQGAPAQDL